MSTASKGNRSPSISHGMDLAGSMPLFPGIPGGKIDTSLPLEGFSDRRLLFNQLLKPGQIHVYSAQCRAGERLRLQMYVPVLPRGGAVVPAFAIVAQSLPYSADIGRLPMNVPAGYSAIVAAPPGELVEPVQDLLTRVHYYPGPLIDTRTLVGGRCYVVVWSPTNHMGKYVVQIGSRWPLAWTYWIQLPWFWWRIRGWFGLDRSLAYAVGAGLILSGLLGLLWMKYRKTQAINLKDSIFMRIILYLGKGGVGKTTVAAASALRSAELGYRTLVVSTDIAHSLADSLDLPLGSEPVAVAPNLFAQEINVLAEVQQHWGQLQGYLGNLLRKRGMNKAIAEEMAIIPGMEEIVSLLHIYRQAETRSYDRVIVDAAPTGETMRLLTMPESFQWYVQRFYDWGDAATRWTGGLLRRVVPDKDLLGGLPELVEDVKKLQGVLQDPDITSYRVVLNPEKMVIKEGARALTYLSLFGYPVDAVVANRILPGLVSDGIGGVSVERPSSDPYLFALQQVQSRYLADIERDFYPLTILRGEWASTEMVGPEQLRGLAEALFRDQDPGQIFFKGQVQTVEEEGSDYVLRMALPHLELEKVKLTKRGDELFVTVGNFKRELILPAVLAKRNAGGAVFANGILTIRFPPSEAQPV